ncbi:MAG: flagellar FlbD family protein [Bryobacteraceae bacterium]
MIRVTRLNRSAIALNSDLIQEIEATPDTVISLTTGQKITVLETEEEIIERVRAWRRSLLANDCAALAASGRSPTPVFGRESQG